MLRALALPPDLLRGLHPDQIKRFRRRAAVESAWELRRHLKQIRLSLLAFSCVPREGKVVDELVELLIQVTHLPLLDALGAIRRAEGEGQQYFRTDEIAIEGVVRPK